MISKHIMCLFYSINLRYHDRKIFSGSKMTETSNEHDSGQSHKIAATFVYALQASAVFLVITSIVALIINYVKKDEVKGTWVESHFDWQIKTFWWVVCAYIVLFAVTSVLSTIFVIIGFPFFFVTGGILLSLLLVGIQLWFLYRVVRGWINLASNKPMK